MANPRHVATSPRVFISYSHDSSEHNERVLELADQLRVDGIRSFIDEYEVAPLEGWPRWMRAQVEKADSILAICTETYSYRFQGKEQPGKGRGANWEGSLITLELYDAEGRNAKFIPVVMSPEDKIYIPTELRVSTHYDVSTDNGYDELYRRLTDQPYTVPPPVGKIKYMPPRDRRQASLGDVSEVKAMIASFRAAGNRLTAELERFFLRVGVPKELLDALPRLKTETYYTCFISYGEPNRQFAERLNHDLVARGVSCWQFSMDATPGATTWREITKTRRGVEKMIVLCSAQSLIRHSLLNEIEDQIDEDPDKIVPVSLDNDWKDDGFHVARDGRDLKAFLLDRNYAEFVDPSNYKASLESLLKGLVREEKQTNLQNPEMARATDKLYEEYGENALPDDEVRIMVDRDMGTKTLTEELYNMRKG